MSKFILFLIMTILLSCNNVRPKTIEKNIEKDTLLKIITTGIPTLQENIQMNFLAKKYGVKYYQMGCIGVKSRMDSIYKINSTTYKILEDKFGKTWRTNFYSMLDTAKKVQLLSNSFIHSHFPYNENLYYYLVMPNWSKNNYEVKVYSSDSIDNKSEELIVHYKLSISLEKVPKFYISKTFQKL